MIILVAILNSRQMSWFYVTSPSLPSTRSGRGADKPRFKNA